MKDEAPKLPQGVLDGRGKFGKPKENRKMPITKQGSFEIRVSPTEMIREAENIEDYVWKNANPPMDKQVIPEHIMKKAENLFKDRDTTALLIFAADFKKNKARYSIAECMALAKILRDRAEGETNPGA